MIARLPSPFAVRQRVSASFETHMVVRWRDSLPGCSNLDLTFLTLEVSFLRRRRMNSRPGCGEGRGGCVSVYAAWNEGTRHAPRSPRQLTCRQSRSLSGGGKPKAVINRHATKCVRYVKPLLHTPVSKRRASRASKAKHAPHPVRCVRMYSHKGVVTQQAPATKPSQRVCVSLCPRSLLYIHT